MAAKGESKGIDFSQLSNAREGVVQRVTPFQQMIRAMASEAQMEAETGEYDGSDLNRMLTAETEDDIWDADERGSLNFQHLTGCQIAITGVSVKLSASNNDTESDMESKFKTQDGKEMYLLVSGYRTEVTGDENKMINLPPIGEEFQANTSARYLVGKIWTFYTRGYIDGDATPPKVLNTYVKGTPLPGGKSVIKLRPVAKRSVSASTE